MSIAERDSLEPWMPDSLKFYSHQIEGIRSMSSMRSVLLADEMGLGKTLQTLAVFCVDVKRRYSDPNGYMYFGETMLVVCPTSLRPNWLEEIEKFTKGVFAMSLQGTPKQRRAQLDEWRARTGPKILVIGYEQLRIHLDELNTFGFHIVAFDEAHKIKNLKAKVTKAALALKSTRSILITGSPILNRTDELYALLERIAPGNWGSYQSFVGRYCVFGGYEGKQIIGSKNTAELNSRLNAVMIRRLKKDVLDLPEVQYIDRIVGLYDEQRKLYREVMNDLKLTTDSGTKDIANGMTKVLRLKQICGTTAAFTEQDHSMKLDQAAEDAKLILDSGHRAVAFTQFRDVQAAFARRLRDNGRIGAEDYPVYLINGDTPADSDGRHPDDPNKRWSRQEIVHLWAENPRPGIIIAMYQVAGVGLNMTAARYGLLLDKLYTPKLNAQAVDRLHRIGADRTQPVQILQYLCHKTAEERVERILAKKEELFDKVVEGNESLSRQILAAALKEED